MGSWSESCGLSGIEIGEGEECYVLLMAPMQSSSWGEFSCFRHFQPMTPLLRGTYNDYGQLTVNDDADIVSRFRVMSKVDVRNGEDYKDRDEHEVFGMSRFWIRADVFNAIRDLPREYHVYRVGDEKHEDIHTYGAAQDLLRAHVEAQVAAIRENNEKFIGKDTASMTQEQRLEHSRAYANAYRMASEVVQSFEHETGRYVRWSDLLRHRLQKTTTLKPFDVATLIECAFRQMQLSYAASVLSKVIVPNERISKPQHGFPEAVTKFAQKVIDIEKIRAEKWN